MLDFEGRTAWITGASSGIGRAVARTLSDEGCRVALSSRSEEDLRAVAEECKGADASVYPLDVTDKDRNATVVEDIVDDYGGIDVAFFNAGVFGTLGDEGFDAEVFEWNMTVNYLGMTYGIDAALPHLEKSDQGYVVGMSSGAAYGPLARGSAYGSSKTAVKYMLDSLDYEWDVKDVDVDVSVICPGVVKTAMTEQENFPYEPPPSFFEVSSDWTGEYIVKKMKRKRHEIRFPVTFILLLKLLGILPNPIHRWCLRVMEMTNVSSGR